MEINSVRLPLKNACLVGLGATLFALLFSGIGFLQGWLVNGEFCFALDDSFIMMAISKNLAFHQVWGLTKYEFSSTASSPLFTVLLSGLDLVFGEHILLPLIVNVSALAGMFLWLSLKARSWGFNQWQTWMLLMGVFYFMPVPVLLFGSMEHILHTWIALYTLQQVIENQEKLSLVKLLFLGAILAGIRYEGLFEGGILVLFLWKNKSWWKGFALGMGMMIPVFWLGIYSLQQGWFFLPNSLVLKGYTMNIQETINFWGFLQSWYSKAACHPHAIVAMLALYLVTGFKSKGNNQNWIWLILLTSGAHFCLARYNHVYRYEAYLMGMTWVCLWKVLCQAGVSNDGKQVWLNLSKTPWIAGLILVMVLIPLYRSVSSYAIGTRAMVNIYEQQVQTAKFIKTYYNEEVIGAIDVGAIAYYTDCRLIDLWGLGDMDIARLRLKNQYKPRQIDSICRIKHLKFSIVYGNVYGTGLETMAWEKQGSWVLSNNAVCSRDTIDFYGLAPIENKILKKNLIEFRPKLPQSVQVIY